MTKEERKIYMREHYLKNKSRINEYKRNWRIENKDRLSLQLKEYRKRPEVKNKIKNYYSKQDKKKLQDRAKLNRNKNKETYAITRRAWDNKKYKHDINYKLTKILRTRLNKSLKRNSKTSSAIELLGCTLTDFRVYLESKFASGMTWDNWSYRGWHIDHIVPLSSFDLTKHEDLVKACHYTNLTPLWGVINMKKGAKLA